MYVARSRRCVGVINGEKSVGGVRTLRINVSVGLRSGADPS